MVGSDQETWITESFTHKMKQEKAEFGGKLVESWWKKVRLATGRYHA